MRNEQVRPLGYHDDTPKVIMEKTNLWIGLVNGCTSLPKESRDELVSKISTAAGQRDQLPYDFGRQVVNIMIDRLKPDYPNVFLKAKELIEQAAFGATSKTKLTPAEEEILNLFTEIRSDASRLSDGLV